MQEPQRFNLLGVLQKSLKCAQKKVYLHRVIYIGSSVYDPQLSQKESKAFNILFESNIKLVNEEYCEDVITGFGLFYTGYFINIVEGPEETLIKHLKTLIDTLEQKVRTPEVDRMKLLFVGHHINRRYYTSWNGRQAIPPLLLDKIDPSSDPEVICRNIENCIMKLYRLSEYLRNQPQNILRAVLDNISDACQGYLPETNLLDFLLSSQALIDLKAYVQAYGSVPDHIQYEENVWPILPDFVPYHVLMEETTKKLMSFDVKMSGKEGEEEETTTIARLSTTTTTTIPPTTATPPTTTTATPPTTTTATPPTTITAIPSTTTTATPPPPPTTTTE